MRNARSAPSDGSVLIEVESDLTLVKTKTSKGLHCSNKYRITMNTQTLVKSSHRDDVITEGNIIEKSFDANQNDLMKHASYAIQICRRYLKALGIWHQNDAGVFFWRTILRYMAIIACNVLIGIRLIPSGLFIIIDEKRTIDRMRLLVRFGFVLMTTTKYYCLQRHRKNIGKLVKHIEIDWIKIETPSSKKIMLKHAHFGNVLTQIYAVFNYTALMFLTVLPVAVKKIRTDKTQYINMTAAVASRRFVVPSHFGFSVFTEPPLFDIILFGQVIGTFILHAISVTCYSLTVVIVTHGCGQLTILKEKLNGLVDGVGEMSKFGSVAGRMADVIRHHVRTLRFIAFGEKMLRLICFLELASYSSVLCFLAYFCLLEYQNDPKQLIAIFAWAVTFLSSAVYIFALCYIGELLFQECVDVADVAYMINWYQLPGKKSLGLGLMFMMARNPTPLTAGGQFVLNYKCFATVMQSTLGYVNMLRTVMD